MLSRLTHCRSCSPAAAVWRVKVKTRVGDTVKLCKKSAQFCVGGSLLLRTSVRDYCDCCVLLLLAYSLWQRTAQRLQLPCKCQSLV